MRWPAFLADARRKAPAARTFATRLAWACTPPLVALVLVLGPEVWHYWTVTPYISDRLVTELRAEPSDSVLAEVAEQSLAGSPVTDRPTLAVATEILRGELVWPGLQPIPVSSDFEPAVLDKGTSTQQLLTASLVIPHVLLKAYEMSGDEAYFAAARRHLTGFARYERQALWPRGLLWNGHAVAARMSVLARFWRHSRVRSDFSIEEARLVLMQVGRAAEMLSKPSHFTFATNHGVMQNIALLQAAVAFPRLPRAGGYLSIADERLREQMRFYVDEGVVLEHSAGYHYHGVRLVSVATRLLQLAQAPVPDGWRASLTRACGFLALLQRPDHTLPLIGDTVYRRYDVPDPPCVIPYTSATGSARLFSGGLFPVAGYFVGWDRLPSRDAGVNGLVQTAATWSNFPGHAHKLADDFSLLLWAEGTNWITNSGYWPYDVWGRTQAEGWEGSNGPHLAGEPAEGEWQTTLRGYADQSRLRALDLEREVPGGPRVRRQVFHLRPSTWLILDTAQDPKNRPLHVLWTTQPGVEVVAHGDASSFSFVSGNTPWTLTVAFRGSAAPDVRLLRGSRDPFAGWVAESTTAKEANALSVTEPSPGGWVLTLFQLDANGKSGVRTGSIASTRVGGAEEWQADLMTANGPISVSRNGTDLRLHGPGEEMMLSLDKGPDVSGRREAIRKAFLETQEKYPPFRGIERYRVRVSGALLASWVVLQLLLKALSHRLARTIPAVRLAANAFWLAGALWVALYRVGL